MHKKFVIGEELFYEFGSEHTSSSGYLTPKNPWKKSYYERKEYHWDF
jgi:hypothetical protein